jgi:hypothetical protein
MGYGAGLLPERAPPTPSPSPSRLQASLSFSLSGVGGVTPSSGAAAPPDVLDGGGFSRQICGRGGWIRGRGGRIRPWWPDPWARRASGTGADPVTRRPDPASDGSIGNGCVDGLSGPIHGFFFFYFLFDLPRRAFELPR